MTNLSFFARLDRIDKVISMGPVACNFRRDIAPHLREPASRRYFYGALTARQDKSEWLEVLREGGEFEAVPEPEKRPDGSVSFRMSLPTQFLVGVAGCESVQQDVHRLALELAETENDRVRLNIADVALALPAEMAAEYVPAAREWLGCTRLGILADRLGQLMERLAKEGQVDAAIELAGALLQVVPGAPQTSTDRSRRATPRFEQFVYRDILVEKIPALVEAAPFQALRVLADTLEKAVDLSTEPEAAADGYDFSHIWRSAIEDHEQNWGYDLKDWLASAVRDAALAITQQEGSRLRDVLAVLQERYWSIFRRLRLYLLSRFPRAVWARTRQELLDRSNLDDYTLVHEYSLLAKAAFALLDREDQTAIIEWVEEGPDTERYSESFRKRHGRPPDQEELRRYVAGYKAGKLAVLGGSDLPSPWRAMYEACVQTAGDEPAHPDFASYHTSGHVQYASPKSRDDLRAMSVAEIVVYAADYDAPRSYTGQPSGQGLANTLQSAVAEDPAKFAGEAEAFAKTGPRYIRSVLEGLHTAVEQGHAFPWTHVLELCNTVAASRGDEADPGEPEGSWAWSRSAALRLIREGMEKDVPVLSLDLRNNIWQVIEKLSDDPDPAAAREEQALQQTWDPHSLSLNTIRSRALHCAMEYALWVWRRFIDEDRNDVKDTGFDALPEVRDVLLRHLDPGREPSLAVRAVYGQWFRWFVSIDTDFAAHHVPRIFPSEPEEAERWRAAWEAYIVWSKPFLPAFKLLKGEHLRAIERLSGSDLDRSELTDPSARLGHHLMTYFWHGEIGIEDELISSFFAKASPAARQRAIDFIGRTLDDVSDSLSGDLRDRLVALIEWRVGEVEKIASPEQAEELVPFGWWFGAAKFEAQWSLTMLKRVLDAAGHVEPNQDVLSRLAVLAEDHSELTLSCLEALLRNARDVLWLARVDDTKEALASVKDHGSDATREKALELVNWLGEQGVISYRDLAD